MDFAKKCNSGQCKKMVMNKRKFNSYNLVLTQILLNGFPELESNEKALSRTLKHRQYYISTPKEFQSSSLKCSNRRK